MTTEQYIKNLSVPAHPVDVVLDTDAYNEIDDQFALCYLLTAADKLRLQAIYAAPFLNSRSVSPSDGMEKSYDEILKLLELAGKSDIKSIVYKGSDRFLTDEKTPVDSPAARDLAARAAKYSAEEPLYVVAIGAITNVASALLIDPSIAEKIVVVWLGGHALHWKNTAEFNMLQDVAAARVVMGCDAPFVQLPCMGVVDGFLMSPVEIEHYIGTANPVCTYLSDNVKEAVTRHKNSHVAHPAHSRVIWDVTAVGWLLNDDDRFMASEIVDVHMPLYDNTYSPAPLCKKMRYVYHINRDTLAGDMFEKLKTL